MKDNLLCIISNAVKFTKEGSKVLIEMDRIQHTNLIHPHNNNTTNHSNNSNSNNSNNNEDRGGVEIEIRVIDNGPPISDNERSRFFEQPSQRERKEGGLGIGLLVLAHRIKALKGI